jgi:hypothetical protein
MRRGDAQFAPEAGEVEMRFEDSSLLHAASRARAARSRRSFAQLMKLAARLRLATRGKRIIRRSPSADGNDHEARARLRLGYRGTRTRAARIEQRGDLHGERAGVARGGVAPSRSGSDGDPVDTPCARNRWSSVPISVATSTGDVAQRCPRQAASAAIDAALVQRGAVAIEQHRLRSGEARAHRREVGQRGRSRRPPRRAEREERGERCGASRAAPRHGATSIASFGRSPMRSGAYIASTRVGGSSKRPG